MPISLAEGRLTTYSYGVPGLLIWITHIILGIYLIYLGAQIVNRKLPSLWTGVILIILGILPLLYHLHLLILSRYK